MPQIKTSKTESLFDPSLARGEAREKGPGFLSQLLQGLATGIPLALDVAAAKMATPEQWEAIQQRRLRARELRQRQEEAERKRQHDVRMEKMRQRARRIRDIEQHSRQLDMEISKRRYETLLKTRSEMPFADAYELIYGEEFPAGHEEAGRLPIGAVETLEAMRRGVGGGSAVERTSRYFKTLATTDPESSEHKEAQLEIDSLEKAAKLHGRYTAAERLPGDPLSNLRMMAASRTMGALGLGVPETPEMKEQVDALAYNAIEHGRPLSSIDRFLRGKVAARVEQMAEPYLPEAVKSEMSRYDRGEVLLTSKEGVIPKFQLAMVHARSGNLAEGLQMYERAWAQARMYAATLSGAGGEGATRISDQDVARVLGGMPTTWTAFKDMTIMPGLVEQKLQDAVGMLREMRFELVKSYAPRKTVRESAAETGKPTTPSPEEEAAEEYLRGIF